MRIAVFGTGGVGGFFGARLAQAGEDVTFLARGEHLSAIREHGLHLGSPDNTLVIRPCRATDDPTTVGHVDVVLLAVKTWQVADAIQAITPLIGSHTLVLPLQNGVESPGQIAEILGNEHVVGGLCGTVSYVTKPGHIWNVGGPSFVKFAELDGRKSDRTAQLLEAFDRAGVQAEIPADIQAAIWEKFLFVVSWGGVGAIVRAPVGILCRMEETRGLLRECMQEILAVAHARRVALAAEVVDKTLKFMTTLAPNGTTSLQRDIADGKPSELEAWNGAVVRLGGKLNVATPLNSFIYRSLLPLETRARGDVDFSTP